MRENKTDLYWMKNDPEKLLIKYQPLFKLISRKYAGDGYYSISDSNEILQLINEKMFTNINKIIDQFDGRVLVRTYLSSICRNIILEYTRSTKRRNELLQKYFVADSAKCEYSPTPVIYIKDEFRRFNIILNLFGSKKNKLILLMKLIYRIKVDRVDFLLFNKEVSKVITNEQIDAFNSDISLKDKDIYRILAFNIELATRKRCHPDTLRKWFNHKTTEIITLMNGYPPRAAYAEDTLQILVEKYYDMINTGQIAPSNKDLYQKGLNLKMRQKIIRLSEDKGSI